MCARFTHCIAVGLWRIVRWSATGCALSAGWSPAAAATYTLPFHESFEPVNGGWNLHAEWSACSFPGAGDCPPDDVLPPCLGAADTRCWGPLKFETYPDAMAGAPVFAGDRSGIQNIFDPYWVSIYHEFDPPVEVGDLVADVWQYDPASVICACECNCDPDGPRYGYPNGRPNYQAQGWLCLQDAGRNEAFALGINSYSSWVYLSWYTRTDGWHRTSVPRIQGWRNLQILVHPYRDQPGDVEFRVNGATVGLGNRKSGTSGPVPVDRLRLGGDPVLITQNHLTNTFEEFRYDEVNLQFVPDSCPARRADFDGDGDADMDDFAIMQRCISSAATFNAPDCHCMDYNNDQQVDAADVSVFAACASRADVPAPTACGN